MSEENSFGSMLKWARMRMQWTQQQIADKLEVSRVTVNRWENDLQLPSAYYLKQIVTLLDLKEKNADALYRAAAQVPPIIDNLPFQRNPFFTGRDEHLLRLRKLLQETGTTEITQSISISGLGGIGKTQLALEYAHRCYPNVYRAVFWVNAADTAALQGSFDKFAQLLDLPEQHEQALEKRIQAVKDWLKTHTNWLLIMDNADDLPLARSFLPSQPLGHVVFTTRSQIVTTITTRARQIEVEALEPDKGLLLLLRRSGVLENDTKLNMVATDIREPATKVVELLGGHPLAVDQAGAYIEETRVSFTDYIKRYRAERSVLLNRRSSQVSGDSEHPEPVATTLKLSFIKACEQHPLASDILYFCAFLHPDSIPVELFQHDESFKFGTTIFDEAIATLHRHSLIKRNTEETTFSIHRLVQAVLIDDMSHDLQRQWRERVVRVLNAAFPDLEFVRVPHPAFSVRRLARSAARKSARYSMNSYSSEFMRAPQPGFSEVNFKDWSQCGRLLPHALICATWASELNPILEASELFHKASICLYDIGLTSEATTLQELILPIYSQHFVVKHPNNAPALDNLADIYYDQRGFSQAEPLYQQAIAIRDKHLGTEHPDNLWSLHKLADIYIIQGESEQAESMLRRVLKIRAKHHVIPDIAILLCEYARLLQQQGKHEQADAWYQRALSIQEQRLGMPSVITLWIKRSYADYLHSTGRDAEAAALIVDDEPSI